MPIFHVGLPATCSTALPSATWGKLRAQARSSSILVGPARPDFHNFACFSCDGHIHGTKYVCMCLCLCVSVCVCVCVGVPLEQLGDIVQDRQGWRVTCRDAVDAIVQSRMEPVAKAPHLWHLCAQFSSATGYCDAQV